MGKRSGNIGNKIFLIIMIGIAILVTIYHHTPHENEVVSKYVIPERYDSNFWHTRITKRPPAYIVVFQDPRNVRYDIQVSKWEYDSYKRGSKVTMSPEDIRAWSIRSKRKPY